MVFQEIDRGRASKMVNSVTPVCYEGASSIERSPETRVSSVPEQAQQD
jgi:hypothetical protein